MKHTISGIVAEGKHIGRRIGSPTINIPLPAEVEVVEGVYAGQVATSEGSFRALVNVGRRPTLGPGLDRTLEAHLLGFDGQLYGERVDVTLLQYIRPERRFSSLEALQEQIATDRNAIETYFRNHPNDNE